MPMFSSHHKDSGSESHPSFITMKDGAQIFYKDWGNPSGQVVFLSHGWPLNSDNWENQMFFLAKHGYRCIAHDRRGHGRSTQTWTGNDMNTWADDIAQILEHLDLKEVTLIGHSTGGGDIARYVGRHGPGRVKAVVLVSAVPPMMAETPTNPEGVPAKIFDDFRAAMRADRAKFFQDVPSGPFFGFNRDGAVKSQGLIDAWFQAGMQASFPAVHDCTYTWQEDYTSDLKAMGSTPVLVVVGDDDQIVPYKSASLKVQNVVPHAKTIVYENAPHALPDTHKDRLNEDLLAFLKG